MVERQGFSLPSFSLCCRFNLYRVLYLSIRPLRWGHFCRLKQKYPKVRFVGTPHLETEFPFCGGKRKISASDAATTVSSANLTFQKHQSAIIFKPHSVMVFSQMKPERPFSAFLFSADFLRWIYMFCLDFFIRRRIS